MISPQLHKRTMKNEQFNEALIAPERIAVVDRAYFCPNLACFTDEVAVRPASSYANVWLVIDEEADKTWLMVAAQPTCPHCAGKLVPVNPDREDRVEMTLPLM